MRVVLSLNTNVHAPFASTIMVKATLSPAQRAVSAVISIAVGSGVMFMSMLSDAAEKTAEQVASVRLMPL